jgi:SAM-dependent methyltransferase
VTRQVTGIDASPAMIRSAKHRVASILPHLASRLDFRVDDIRSSRVECDAETEARTSTAFDVVVSLFHVMSFLTTDMDLQRGLRTAREHLRAGGIFMFDAWYGPGVLKDPPALRVKRVEDEELAVTRLSEPRWIPRENVVHADFTFFVREKATGSVEEIKETCSMRCVQGTHAEQVKQPLLL